MLSRGVYFIPQQIFIIKTNHGSGGNKIILNKKEEDEGHLKELFAS